MRFRTALVLFGLSGILLSLIDAHIIWKLTAPLRFIFGDSAVESDDEIGMPVEEIIRKYGYPVEVHDITTADGYILQTFRIPHGKEGINDGRGRQGEPVLINHAFLSSAADFFHLTPDNVLPFMYADAGFDVWLGNFRGNSFSSRHVSYSSDEFRFWNFTLDDLAVYDIPAQIDYILEHTKRSKLLYYGYSLGGGVFFQMLSARPEYNDKVRRMTIVVPSGYYDHCKSPILANNFSLSTLQNIYDTLFNGCFVTSQFMHRISPYLCSMFPRACYLAFESVGDVNSGQISLKTLMRKYRKFPQYTSVRSYIQLMQWFRSGTISYYDYGEAENLAKYSTPAPPLYNYSLITVPMCGLYGYLDPVVAKEDAIHTMSETKKWCNRDNAMIQNKNWGHLDSMYAKDVGKLVFSRSVHFFTQDHSICNC